MKYQYDEIRRELLAMGAADQEMRLRCRTDRRCYSKKLDMRHTARLKEIVRLIGWPSWSKVGRKASHAAWLLVQHADHDVAFQKTCLRDMKYLAKLARGPIQPELDLTEMAYLEDRICINEKRPQMYGTQYIKKDGVLELRPIWRPGLVDVRRHEVGLEPLSVYFKRVKRREAKLRK